MPIAHEAFATEASTVLARVAAHWNAQEPLPGALVVLAHPDDEVLALGARLERFAESVLLCVTDGAPSDGEDARAHGFETLPAYREARRAELDAALALAAVPGERARTLLLEEDGMRAVEDKGAMASLVQITRQLRLEIERFRPEVLVTHPYEGGHPDHDSCAFAVHATVRLLRIPRPPVIVEAPSYFNGEHGMVTSSFLPKPASSQLIVCELSPEEQARKQARLDCFRSQQSILANFGVERELFRIAPIYDFTAPPHAGPLLYESFGWGITGQQFCAHARAALRSLGLAPGAEVGS